MQWREAGAGNVFRPLPLSARPPAHRPADAPGIGGKIPPGKQEGAFRIRRYPAIYAELEHLSSARVYTHFAVREDAQTLYGFATREEREVFRLLVSVSGVGGNTARMILSTYSPAELANILATENAVLLKNVKGLGLKTAQKIIVELKDKAAGLGSTGTGSPAQTIAAGTDETRTEATAALTMLGFGKAASEKAVQSILKETPSAGVEEVIRLALKKL